MRFLIAFLMFYLAITISDKKPEQKVGMKHSEVQNIFKADDRCRL